MDFVKQIVAQIIKEPTPAAWSVACLATTNPVYLLFSNASDAPLYVARVTPAGQRCTHDTGVLLHKAAGDLVPEPIGLVHRYGKRFSVQKGVTGAPWFQVAHQYSDPGRWDALRAMATTALRQFHYRIRQSLPQELKPIRPAEELLSAHNRFLRLNGSEPDGLSAMIASYGKILESLGQIEGVPQHGDFSLNNLIVRENPTHVTIIDFEDFNLTQMPLYDEFTLALSLYTAAPRSVNAELHRELTSCIEACSDQALYDGQIVQGLFLYHLLTRLGDWSLGLKRQPYRQWLLTLLDQFTSDPSTLFPR